LNKKVEKNYDLPAQESKSHFIIMKPMNLSFDSDVY